MNTQNPSPISLNKHRTNISAKRVMRFCFPDGVDQNPDLFDAIGVEDWKPAAVRNTDALPLFGSLVSYGATIKRQRKLWNLEIHRLLLVTESSGADILAPKLRANEHSPLQSPIHKVELDVLRTAADQLLHSLHVCVIDDQKLLNDKFPHSERTKGVHSYRQLQKVVKMDSGLPGQYEGTNVGTNVGNNHFDEETEREPKYSASVRAIVDSELEDYYYLVDQITATMARLAILGSDSQYWHVVVLACLAKLSTKLKFLAVKLDKNITRSLRKGFQYDFEGNQSEAGVGDRNDFGHLTDSSETVHRYCTEFDVVTTWLVDSLTQILRDIGARKPWGLPSDHLDLCAIIYRAGISGTQTILYQGRGDSISGSSTAIPLEYSSSALKLIFELGTTCFSTSNTSSDNSSTTSKLTFESAEFIDGKFQVIRKTWILRTIMEMVLVSIPLSLSNPTIGCGFETSLRTISALSAFGKTKLPVTNRSFSAFVGLRSSRNISLGAQREFSSLSDSVLASIRHNVLQRRALISSVSGEHSHLDNRETPLMDAQKYRQYLKETIDKWAIQETSIVIGCAAYVHAMIFLSAALVIGGLLCGFLVGDRIVGVDPFNLTMFSWIIGGFLILIAKSVMVSDWTWRDLLLRQVTCRSLSEVSSVTGLDAQDLLVFLLSSEFQTILRTGGPYQRSFFRDSTADGFSIDIKPTLQTLLASGIIPVMVSTLDGPVLMRIRVIPGSSGYRRIGTKGTTSKAPVYLDFPKFGVKGDAVATPRTISWIKVLGLYNSTTTTFR